MTILPVSFNAEEGYLDLGDGGQRRQTRSTQEEKPGLGRKKRIRGNKKPKVPEYARLKSYGGNGGNTVVASGRRSKGSPV